MTLVNEETTASAPGTRTGTADTSGAHTHGGPVVPEASRAARATSFDVADFPVPTGREEEWKFSPLRELAPLFDDAAPARSAAVEVSAPDVVEHRTGTLAEVGAGSAFVPGDRAAVTGWATTDVAHLVKVPAEAELDAPVVVTVRGETGVTTSGHVVVETGHHAKALVVLSHLGGGAHRGNVEVRAGDASDLTVVSLQEWDADALHVGQQDVLVGRDARVRHIVVTLGGKAVRVSANISYAAPGGDATALGVYFAGAGQHSEHRQFVDHTAVNCKSYVEYKGALQGESAHAVWIGDVLIRASAEGTETYELNRNLVLTDGARADSVPNLEIETGEIVGAGHASATGRFDDEQLFYLQSRGITAEEARRLVVRGFFASIVEKIGIPEISTRLMTTIETQLAQNVEEN
ncbi:Fe-S cluster assembly protein SufD [Kineococcus rhizosphaerae]|uniref:Iron-regulated ABC transporter permease protein SufD n=1 Tax=Kineococcus rhizosphaerae TaxID=559628 RepID=A0A2T0RA42_9ACTN|nr:Fe-S cluster assembly protein SufD [Kineococcus rhizosphaerae]PRY18023.1 iron-regulated ABC transporter permease protein SufD [Kineococcus rhizosphaerae]